MRAYGTVNGTCCNEISESPASPKPRCAECDRPAVLGDRCILHAE